MKLLVMEQEKTEYQSVRETKRNRESVCVLKQKEKQGREDFHAHMYVG